MAAKTVEIRMEHGDPNEYRTAKLQRTIFHAAAFPRGHIDQLKGKKASKLLSGSGVYFLIGPKTSRIKRDVYIGESTNLINRLRIHNKKRNHKHIWESVVVISTTNNEINSKTRYVEAELMGYKKNNRSWKVVNDNSSNYKSEDLPTSDIDFVLDFINASKVMLACLGCDFLCGSIKKSTQISSKPTVRSAGGRKGKTKFICRGLGGVYAEMTIDSNGGFVVSKGSVARGRLTDSLVPAKRSDRQRLIRSKILKKQGENYIFTKDYTFGSVSDAATQVMGCLRNGNLEWKIDGIGKTYGDWKKSNKGKAKK